MVANTGVGLPGAGTGTGLVMNLNDNDVPVLGQQLKAWKHPVLSSTQ